MGQTKQKKNLNRLHSTVLSLWTTGERISPCPEGMDKGLLLQANLRIQEYREYLVIGFGSAFLLFSLTDGERSEQRYSVSMPKTVHLF
jgi:hypothetical protein